MGNINFYGELFNSGGITPEIQKALEVARAYGISLVKARTPVDSGLLRANWDAQVQGRGIKWTNPTSYASYVELGTKKMRPRYMLTDSLPDIAQVFEEELGKQIQRKASSPGYGNIAEGYKGGYVGGTVESTLINRFRERGKNKDIQRRDLISDTRRKAIKEAKPRWQAKPYSPDQGTMRF